ncbi:hypothetical protein CBR_g21272 [Chara braunii]|uniref:Deoxyuridine 5'-triphosphate nucleotidohydrolase n=1 Tax=Chara braunii TaxID=69332 RepID=A0A388L1C6_CHABU|nr:hypothetical protein CBR_g21272 [Chara braunii]|eukprot:GBG76032.1 hypothetical protein CBR_g21272 [Chara braunii]
MESAGGAANPTTMDVHAADPDPDTAATVVSGSVPRQPHSKVQKIESRREDAAVGIPPDCPGAAVPAVANGCGNDANNGAQPDEDTGVLRVEFISDKAVLPKRFKNSSGYDLYTPYSYVIPPGGRCEVKTGIKVAVPKGTYGHVVGRSRLAYKHFITPFEGVIDANFRGEVIVLLFSHSKKEYKINAGDRVAQLVLERIATPEVKRVDKLNDTERGADGFGSTGR